MESSNSNFDRIRPVEIEVAIGIGVAFPSFPSIPISIWIPKSTTIMRIATVLHCRLVRQTGFVYTVPLRASA